MAERSHRTRRRRKLTSKDEKPTTGQVLGTALLRLGRRMAGGARPVQARPDVRQIVPKPAATIRRIRCTCTNCDTTYEGPAVRLRDGRATCTDCGEQAMYVDFDAEALMVI